jgi:hypothetical protein
MFSGNDNANSPAGIEIDFDPAPPGIKCID